MDRPWGKWTRLYGDDRVELRLLEIEPGGFCTLHRHEYQANLFYVVAGDLIVYSRWPNHEDLYPQELGEGESTLVQSGAIHQFRAETQVVAYELNIATGPNPLDPSDSIQLGPAGRDA